MCARARARARRASVGACPVLASAVCCVAICVLAIMHVWRLRKPERASEGERLSAWVWVWVFVLSVMFAGRNVYRIPTAFSSKSYSSQTPAICSFLPVFCVQCVCARELLRARAHECIHQPSAPSPKP